MKQLPYPVITTTDLPGFKLHSKGKVRDIYDIDENTLLLVTTDRMSAFDVILGEPIPWKGVILNQLTLFWMNKFAHLIPTTSSNPTWTSIRLRSSPTAISSSAAPCSPRRHSPSRPNASCAATSPVPAGSPTRRTAPSAACICPPA